MINNAILGVIAGGRPQSVTPPGGDPYWDNVVLLCRFDGTNLSQVMPDISPYARTQSIVGGSASYPRLETAEKKFGTASVYSDGTGARRASWAASSSAYFGAGDFTVEAWIKVQSSTGYGNVLSRWGATAFERKSWFFGEREGRALFAYYTASNVFTEVATGVQTLSDQFHHIAASRNGSTLRVFVDGVQGASATISTTIRDGVVSGEIVPFFMGSDGDSANSYQGWVDEARVTVGVGRYTSNFTPPTAEFPNYGV